MALVQVPCRPCDRYVNPATIETVDVIEADSALDKPVMYVLRLRFVSGQSFETPPMPKPEVVTYVAELGK